MDDWINNNNNNLVVLCSLTYLVIVGKGNEFSAKYVVEMAGIEGR